MAVREAPRTTLVLSFVEGRAAFSNPWFDKLTTGLERVA